MLYTTSNFIEVSGIEFELITEFQVYGGQKAIVNALPENCQPEESPELDILDISVVYDNEFRGDSEHYKAFAKLNRLLDGTTLDDEIETFCWEYLESEEY